MLYVSISVWELHTPNALVHFNQLQGAGHTRELVEMLYLAYINLFVAFYCSLVFFHPKVRQIEPIKQKTITKPVNYTKLLNCIICYVLLQKIAPVFLITKTTPNPLSCRSKKQAYPNCKFLFLWLSELNLFIFALLYISSIKAPLDKHCNFSHCKIEIVVIQSNHAR